jgi:AcrR family transcriptional regulator
MPDTQHSTREKILDAALLLFSQKGYLGATTKEIAAESGVAEVTLFRHFSSKEALLEEVLTSNTFLPALKEMIPSVLKLPYEEALSEIARRFLESLDLRQDFIKILHSERHLYSEKIRISYHSAINEIFMSLAVYFEEMQKKEILRKFDCFLGARAFFGMFFSYFTQSKLLMFKKLNPRETEHLIKEYVQIFVRGTIREDFNNNGKKPDERLS